MKAYVDVIHSYICSVIYIELFLLFVLRRFCKRDVRNLSKIHSSTTLSLQLHNEAIEGNF